MPRISLIPLLVTLCLLLLLAFGCKREAPRMPPPAETESPEVPSTTPSSLEEAIYLYENPSSPGDVKESVKVFNTQAYSNDPEAQYYLGLARHEGKGADQSDLEAYVWWTIAARQYHLRSMDRIENIKDLFGEEDLAEIKNRADDWEEKVRSTPEMN
jgi:TPR repeat protein